MEMHWVYRVMPIAIIICCLIFIPAFIVSMVSYQKRKKIKSSCSESNIILFDDSLIVPFGWLFIGVATFLLIMATVQSIMEGKPIIIVLIYPLAFIYYIVFGYIVLKAYFWRVQIMNNEMYYRNALGVTQKYMLEDIKIRYFVNAGGFTKYVFCTSEKDLFTIYDSDRKKFELLFQALKNVGVIPTVEKSGWM